MKNILYVLFSSLAIISCNSIGGRSGKSGYNPNATKGEIIADNPRATWDPIKPTGMVPIPSGSFVIGQSDYDFVQKNDAPTRTVSVSAFYMDETEVTNAEYRDFINYVRDSVVRSSLAEKALEQGVDVTGEGEGIAAYAYKTEGVDDKEDSPYLQYLRDKQTGRDGGEKEGKRINWDAPLIWDTGNYPDVSYAEVVESFYYPPKERFNGEKAFDVRKLIFSYSWIDTESAVKDKNPERSKYVIQESLPIYPDTTVWSRDFSYAHNEPMHEFYFSHKSYSDYPVVGVNWKQAQAYCAYKTKKHNDYLKQKKRGEKVFAYRLPTEVEWEYAARGGLDNAPYPWGGPYLMDDRGCYLANFKPKRGDYIEDHKKGNYMYTGKVKSFTANGYGLYDMAGNVAEWTSSPYDASSYTATSTINPSLGVGRRYPNKTIRGGSWKDVGHQLMVSARDSEHQDSARSFVGFRTVQSLPEGVQPDVKINNED
ncbi:MAG: gliding motility lipoprotein GldK [Flavobacteriaceae bacterium]|nr:MAG: gliding motility lipoprotein GldK [Flavobacteriaceae bacterium]